MSTRLSGGGWGAGRDGGALEGPGDPPLEAVYPAGARGFRITQFLPGDRCRLPPLGAASGQALGSESSAAPSLQSWEGLGLTPEPG